MRGYRKAPAISRIAPLLPFSGVTTSPDSPDFKWPSSKEIQELQKKHSEEAPSAADKTDSPLRLVKGAERIPNEAVELKLRYMTIAHAGSSGRHGADSTWHALRKEFYWTEQREDVRRFVSSCLLCLFSKSGNKFPRPLSISTHASKPNQVIHF